MRPKPASIAASVAPAPSRQPSSRAASSGPKAEPIACQANSTRVKIPAGTSNAISTAMTDSTSTTTRANAGAPLVTFAPRQSWASAAAAVKSWLSAVDMIADNTAASTSPPTIGGSSALAA